MSMLGFPFLLIPFAIYNIIAFLMPDVTWGAWFLRSIWFRAPTGPCRRAICSLRWLSCCCAAK
jgi:hypothetical protein